MVVRLFCVCQVYDSRSSVFDIRFGVRQGSVLSLYLFSVYIDDVGQLCDFRNGSFVLLYADNILLITSSVSELQSLVTACEELLLGLDMSLNVGKSSCIAYVLVPGRPMIKAASSSSSSSSS